MLWSGDGMVVGWGGGGEGGEGMLSCSFVCFVFYHSDKAYHLYGFAVLNECLCSFVSVCIKGYIYSAFS